MGNDIRINVSSTGVGQRKYNSKGAIGIQKIQNGPHGHLEFSIGRGSANYCTPALKAAWGLMNYAEAHQFAAAILHLIGEDMPCVGQGIKTIKEQHTINLRVNIDYGVDLCTVMADPEALKKEVIGKFTAAYDKAVNEFKKEEPNADPK